MEVLTPFPCTKGIAHLPALFPCIHFALWSNLSAQVEALNRRAKPRLAFPMRLIAPPHLSARRNDGKRSMTQREPASVRRQRLAHGHGSSSCVLSLSIQSRRPAVGSPDRHPSSELTLDQLDTVGLPDEARATLAAAQAAIPVTPRKSPSRLVNLVYSELPAFGVQ